MLEVKITSAAEVGASKVKFDGEMSTAPSGLTAKLTAQNKLIHIIPFPLFPLHTSNRGNGSNLSIRRGTSSLESYSLGGSTRK